MADDGFTLKIDPVLAERLRAAADAAGETVEDFARHALETVAHNDPSWQEDVDRLAEYDRTGVSVPADEAMDWLRSAVAARFDKRG